MGLKYMINLSEHQQDLLLGKMTGSLSRSESEELEALLADNEDVKAAFKDLISKLPAEYVNNSFGHLNNPEYWSELDNKYKVRSLSATWRKLSVAALVAGIIGLGLYFMSNNKNENRSSALTSQKSVELKLANGTTIDLTNQQGNLSAGTLLLQNNDQVLTYNEAANDIVGMNSITVPTGMNYAINLADGSKVWMNSTTTLDFPSRFIGKTREITVSGEAYFQIAKNAAQPFIIHLPESTVEVTGTEFNVNTYNKNELKVSLVEGGLNFRGRDNVIKINPGEEAFYNRNEASLRAFDAKTVLSWRKGLFYFDEASIDEISMVIERWFGVKSRIDNPKIIEMKFAGVLDKNKPLEVFLDDLKVIGKISSYTDSQGILHFK